MSPTIKIVCPMNTVVLTVMGEPIKHYSKRGFAKAVEHAFIIAKALEVWTGDVHPVIYKEKAYSFSVDLNEARNNET